MFTAPRAGVYLITFSYESDNDPGEQTLVYIYKNGAMVSETGHGTAYSPGGRGWVHSASGRAVYQRLGAGDTITLQTYSLTGYMGVIMFCVQFINN